MRNRFNYSGFPDLTRPTWAGREINSNDLLPGGSKLDEPSFTAYTAAVVVTLTGAAAAGAVALAVSALTGPIPAGTMLNFGVAKSAYVTQAAAAAAVALTIAPLVTPLAIGDSARFNGQYGLMVPAGTFVSRTFAQRAAGTGFHPAIAAEDEYFLTAFEVRDLTLDNDVALVVPGKGFPIKENFLPNIAGITAVPAVLAALRARYLGTIGAE
jgi:hypothetical protein